MDILFFFRIFQGFMPCLCTPNYTSTRVELSAVASIFLWCTPKFRWACEFVRGGRGSQGTSEVHPQAS